MSFQDVGRNNRRQPNRGGFGSAPSSGSRVVVVGGDEDVGSTGYERLSDWIVQYQRNVGLLEKMARSVATPNDTSVLQTQYSLQTEVITQLSTKIESQLSTLEHRLSSLPRVEATPLRSTHVKLCRDYRLVQQQFKNVLLDVNKKRALMEVQRRQPEGAAGSSGDIDGGDEVLRRQMQIQEDRINEEIMREREEEIRNIHKGMYQVNEIYKDLAHLVDNQQEGIDQIETQMEGTKENTATGLKHIQKANEHQQSQCVVS